MVIEPGTDTLLRHVLRGQYPGPECLVGAFYFWQVQQSGGVADQKCTRHFESRQGLRAALDDRASTTRQNLSPVKQGLYERMVLELLERLERGERGVCVIQRTDEAHGDAVLV